MKQYELCGFLNMFDIVPDFVYPIFRNDNIFYFQDGENDIINNFVPVKPSIYARIHKIGTCETIIGIKSEIASINSKPLYAFQVNESEIVCGKSDFILDFFTNYSTDNPILEEEINDLISEIYYPFIQFLMQKRAKTGQYVFNIMGGQVNINNEGTMYAIQNCGAGTKELDSIIKDIKENLSDLKSEDAESIIEVVEMAEEELIQKEPKIHRLENCISLITSVFAIAKGMPLLIDNLQKLIDYIFRFLR